MSLHPPSEESEGHKGKGKYIEPDDVTAAKREEILMQMRDAMRTGELSMTPEERDRRVNKFQGPVPDPNSGAGSGSSSKAKKKGRQKTAQVLHTEVEAKRNVEEDDFFGAD
jgi:hypothetical protein